MTMTYIVLCAQVVGGNGRPFDINYNFDGKRFRCRHKAIAHGLKLRGSDDFNIGVLKRKKLVSLDWMNEPTDTEPDVLRLIESQICL